jgi:hypothetical protein
MPTNLGSFLDSHGLPAHAAAAPGRTEDGSQAAAVPRVEEGVAATDAGAQSPSGTGLGPTQPTVSTEHSLARPESLSDLRGDEESPAMNGSPPPVAASAESASSPPRPPDRSIHDFLGDEEPAPRGEGGKGGKGRGMGIEALLALACPTVLDTCLAGADFPAAGIRQAVAAIAAVYTNANVLGTALGDGVHGIGLHLWRGRRGLFRACRENAVLAAKRMKVEELEALARKRGLAGIQELAQAIQHLPSAKPTSL